MSYKAGIIQAVTRLNERTGSSSIAIKKQMLATFPEDKKWNNAAFLRALKEGVASGVFVKVDNSYKISAEFEKARVNKFLTAQKKAAASKKKAVAQINAPKKIEGSSQEKSAPKKKAAPKKKTALRKINYPAAADITPSDVDFDKIE